MSDGDFPWLNTADSFFLKPLAVPIALTTALFSPWAMTPFPLSSVRNDFDSAVFLFVALLFPPPQSCPCCESYVAPNPSLLPLALLRSRSRPWSPETSGLTCKFTLHVRHYGKLIIVLQLQH